MAATLNRVVLLGRVVRRQLRQAQSGLAIAELAVSVARLAKAGGADVFTVIAFGKVAEDLARVSQDGSLVLVDGRLQAREWTTQAGDRRYVIEVVAERCEVLTDVPAVRPADDEVPF